MVLEIREGNVSSRIFNFEDVHSQVHRWQQKKGKTIFRSENFYFAIDLKTYL